MYRLKFIMMSAVFILATCFLTLAQEATSTDVIYLLDVSGSMKKGALFENIKGRLKKLVEERKVGDKVILGIFSEDVLWPLKVDIHIPEDISDIEMVIDNLTAEGPWTWMSKAFRETKEKAQDIKAKSPDKRLMIYILTDCINDPPPHIKKVEPPWKFVEVLLKYFEGFEAKDTYIYLLSYRPLEQEEKTKIEKKTIIEVKEPKVTRPMPRIKLSFSGFDFGKIDFSKGEVTRSGEISVDDLQDVERGEKVQLIPPPNFKVRPETIACKEKGHKEKVSIIIPSDLKAKEYTEIIGLRSKRAAVEPSELKFSFFVLEDGLIGKLLKAIFPLLIVVLLYVLYDAFIRERTVWVEKIGAGRIKEVKLKGWKKVYMRERIADKYITFGLSKNYLQRARLKNAVFLIKEDGGKDEVVFSEDVQCKDSDGNEFTLRFYKEEPIEGGPGETEEETEGPSPWDRIEGKDE